jgi:hypothetical protein
MKFIEKIIEKKDRRINSALTLDAFHLSNPKEGFLGREVP